MSRENVEVVLRMYEGMNSGVRAHDLSDEVLATTFDPAIEMEQLEDLVGTTGTFHGYEGLRNAARELNDVLEGNRWELLGHAAEGDRVAFAARACGAGRTSGAAVELDVGHLFEMRGGRIARWVVYRRPADALDAVRRSG